MESILKVKSFTQTCEMCPSQWEIELEDGSWLYVRYRWGNLTVSIGPTVKEAVSGDLLLEKEIGDSLDGLMSSQDLFFKHIPSIVKISFKEKIRLIFSGIFGRSNAFSIPSLRHKIYWKLFKCRKNEHWYFFKGTKDKGTIATAFWQCSVCKKESSLEEVNSG